jgi:putative ABC transport system substrate-binding protein
VRRREFIAALAGGVAVALPRPGRAQKGYYVLRRVGVLTGLSETDQNTTSYLRELRSALHDSGWVEGRNIRFDDRFAGGDSRRALMLARELVELKPDLLIAHTTPAAAALRQATSTIPIVFVSITDPVAGGFVASLARPGGNITGFTNYDYSMGTKWLEILKELAPGVSSVAVMLDPETGAYYAEYMQAIEAVAASRGVQAERATVHEAGEMVDVIAALARKPGGGLIILPSVSITAHSRAIIDAAARDRVPAIYPFGDYARNGGLVAYGVDLLDLFHRAASYADRILRGERPADLPVQAPTKFELIINLKTAKALGLSVPQSILARADEVIE